jgi:hypothetical protein
MVVLVPLKPVAVVLGLLSALIFVSYFGSALIHGRDPFAVNSAIWRHPPAQHVSGNASTTRKAAEKQPAEASK